MADTCAHSEVEFRVDGDVLIQPSDGDWAVSAAALFLLRTLSRPHTKANPVGAQLFPHCGRIICAAEGEDALIFCCNTGMDFEIRHVEGGFDLGVSEGRIIHMDAHDWREAVARFSDTVRAFYAASSPKTSWYADEAKGVRAISG